MTGAIRAYPNDPLRQVSHFLGEVELQAFTGRKRIVSERTREVFGDVLLRAVKELRVIRMPIQSIDQIGRRQVMGLVAYWVNEEGQAPATVANKVSQLRKYCALIGKKDAVPKRAEFYELLESKGIGQEALARVQVTPWSKTWSAAGVDPVEFIEKIRVESPHEALLMETMLAFGLRVSEALGLRPHGSEEPDGLMVHRETKGGRWRKVRFLSDPEQAAYQRDVLARCKAWVKDNRSLQMGYEGLTMKQARKRFYNTMEYHGVSLKERGVVSHGLRHEFASNLFFDITGHRPPAEGQEPPKWFEMNREAVRDAYKQVSEALGHWRVDISSAYLGSVPKMSKVQSAQVERVVAMVEGTPGVGAGLLETGVTRAWLTGRAAHGIEIPAREKITLTVQMQAGASMAEFGAAQAVLEKLLPGRITLVPLVNAAEPAEGLEVFLDR